MDRKQRLVSGTAALKTRIARASYGVLCRQLYDPNIHFNADVQYDFYVKRQKWAMNQIDWLIKKVGGTPILNIHLVIIVARAIRLIRTPPVKRRSQKRLTPATPAENGTRP